MVFYTDAKCQLLGIITTLMSKVISSGVIPDQWKVAKIIPLYKKGKKDDVENYRPISNLCSITKICEKLILYRINMIEKTENTDLTGTHQFGFKEGRSTESACLELQ